MVSGGVNMRRLIESLEKGSVSKIFLLIRFQMVGGYEDGKDVVLKFSSSGWKNKLDLFLKIWFSSKNATYDTIMWGDPTLYVYLYGSWWLEQLPFANLKKLIGAKMVILKKEWADELDNSGSLKFTIPADDKYKWIKYE